MPQTLIYPQNAELRTIERDMLPVLEQDDPVFSIMPIEEVNSSVVMWEQEDDFVGLQQIRGMNGAPPVVKSVGGKRFVYEPGIYGEHMNVDEMEMTLRRGWGDFATPVDISDLVRRRQDQLMTREVSRLKQIAWTLLSTGTFSILNQDGVVLHTDTFALQTLSAAMAWATVATATPLVDFRNAKLLGRGHSVNFGSQARAYANSTTVNSLLNNANAADLFGKRISGGNTFNSLADFNRIFLENDLPQVVEYDEGYKNEAGAFTLFLPNNKVIIVGRRSDGGRIAAYHKTRNANNEGFAPGSYVKVVDDMDRVPRQVEVHRGHNGGPCIYFPSAIIILTV